MKVRIIKMHKIWLEVFAIGDIVELNGHIITALNGIEYNADELCKAFSNRCLYPDLFKKI